MNEDIIPTAYRTQFRFTKTLGRAKSPLLTYTSLEWSIARAAD